MHFLIGDLQGCCDAFDRLLAEIGFSPSRDRLHVLGDIVNRGPQSLRTLQRLRQLEGSATALLGNHDLHLLAVAEGIRPEHPSDTLHEILASPDRDSLLAWVRNCPLADTAHGWLLVHAGLAPQWDPAKALELAAEVQNLLRGPDLLGFLRVMYGNEPRRWDDSLSGPDRWRFVINVMTRIRFCRDDGTLDFSTKDGADAAPPGFRPWFDVPGRRSAAMPVAFGHWSTLGLRIEPRLMALDTGCVWGGELTAVRIDGGRQDVFRIRCGTPPAG